MRKLLALLMIGLFLLSCKDKMEKNVEITSSGQPAQLDIRKAGENSIRITLRPLGIEQELPYTPALAEREYPEPIISLRKINDIMKERVGNLLVEVRSNPLTITVSNAQGELVQEVAFLGDSLTFKLDDQPVLGMGEGGPRAERGSDWRSKSIEFDRRGRLHKMEPRWQANAYGSRNPVAMMMGTSGWGIFVATPWGQVNLENENLGIFVPWNRDSLSLKPQGQRNQHEQKGKGIHPREHQIAGLYDIFIFDAHDPVKLMKDVSLISGPAVLPPKWALGYMQSHRTLQDETQMLEIVETFREKEIPVDAVIYLGTGFTPRGWNKRQPSFDYNTEVFIREGEEVISDLHDKNVKVVLHMVPPDRNELQTLHGTIPPKSGEELDSSHIAVYWQKHEDLMEDGVDGFWPDEGDWFNLFERMKRHQMYYQGPISTRPNIRPWSLHRNGHLGVAKWGGWVWSGDTEASWKTLEGQIAVGINHSLSLSPFWGSDIGGFYPNKEKTGELYVRWFQFGAFNPSFRSHARTWFLSLPWGWGLSDMGVRENDNQNSPGGNPERNVLQSEMNNPEIEPIAKKYAELRYQLLSYNYSLAWEASTTGMPMMRAMWLHYPDDEVAKGKGGQYLWGRDMLIAPVFTKNANSRKVYLPKGEWYDWWTNQKEKGGKSLIRDVDLATMPIYIRAGAIIPFDPVRQYTSQEVNEPTTLKVYTGANGEFNLYEDDGITLEYLEGEAEITSIKWDNEERKLTIEPFSREGDNQCTERIFRIEFLPEGIIKDVRYMGEPVEIEL